MQKCRKAKKITPKNDEEPNIKQAKMPKKGRKFQKNHNEIRRNLLKKVEQKMVKNL